MTSSPRSPVLPPRAGSGRRRRVAARSHGIARPDAMEQQLAHRSAACSRSRPATSCARRVRSAYTLSRSLSYPAAPGRAFAPVQAPRPRCVPGGWRPGARRGEHAGHATMHARGSGSRRRRRPSTAPAPPAPLARERRAVRCAGQRVECVNQGFGRGFLVSGRSSTCGSPMTSWGWGGWLVRERFLGEDFGAMAGGFRITAVAFDGDRTLVKVRSSARDG